MRRDPKAALEGDFKAVLVGLVIAFVGSILVAGTFYWTTLNSQPGPAMPVVGTVIFFIGVAVLLVGVALGILCIGVNLWGWLGKVVHHDGGSPSSESH